MKRIFAVAVFVVAGLAIVAGMILRAVDNPQPVQAQGVLVAQPTASPQPTATAIPSPTLDYHATQVIQQTSLTNAQAELARVNLQIEQTNLQVQQSKEREAQAIASIAANEAEKSANNLRITEAQNERMRLEIELKELEIQREHVENERAAILTRQKEVENQARMGWIVPAGWLTVAGAAIYLGRQIGKNRAERGAEAEQDEPLEHIAQVTDAPTALPAYPGGLDVRLFATFLSPGTLRKAARLVLNGVPLTHDNYTPISNCMSEGQFTKLQNALVEYRAAEWVDETHKAGIMLNKRGEAFFADLLTTPPLGEDVQRRPPTGLKTPIDDGFIPLAEGE